MDEEFEDLDFFTTQTSQTGFSDPRGEYPRISYHYKPSLNTEIYGNVKTVVSLGGGDPALKISGFTDGDTVPPQYGKVQVQETASGHKIILDDTPGGERVLVYHNTGSGIEFKPDGTINVRAKNNMGIVIDADGVIIVEGDLKVSTKNLTVDVSGDLDMNVSNDWNITVGGDKKETIEGSYRQEITGNFGQTIKKSSSKTVLGSDTTTILGSSYNIVKNNVEFTTGVDFIHAIGRRSKQTSQGEMVQSAPSISISAADLTAIGAGGTIGGDNMIYYGTTAHIDRVNSTSMHATTFHGDLNGTALQANETASQNYGEGATEGAAFDYTSTEATNNTSTEPTEDLMTKVLSYSTRGIAKVKIDLNDFIKNKIDRTTAMGGIAVRKLSVEETRMKLKDQKHIDNNKFITQSIANKVLSDSYLIKTPPAIGRIYSGKGSVSFIPQGANVTSAGSGTGKFVASDRKTMDGFRPDKTYDPMLITPDNGVKTINSKTLVGKGIPISTFLSGKGFSTNLGHIGTHEERQALARQLLIQTEVIKIVRNNQYQFRDFRAVVVEGVYKKLPTEELTPGSILDLATKGRAITYELYDEDNKQYPEITFQFAEYLAEYLVGYDKIILHYDTFDPGSTKIHSQVTVVFPELDELYNLVPGPEPLFELETRFNGKVLSNSDLTEVSNYQPPSVGRIGVVGQSNNILEYRVSGIRDGQLNRALERILIQAANKVGLDKIVITSAKQPGSTGRRLGSMRHDTGNAVDVYIIYKGQVMSSATSSGRKIMGLFVTECVRLGVRGGGHGANYMGPTVMHLDTLGRNLGGGKFDASVLTTWKSEPWFIAAMKKGL